MRILWATARKDLTLASTFTSRKNSLLEKGLFHEFRNFAEAALALIVLKRALGVLGIKEANLEASGNGAVEKHVLACG